MPEEEFRKILKKWREIARGVDEYIEEEFKKIEREVRELKAMMEPSWTSNGTLKPLYSIRETPDSYIIYVDIPQADEGSLNVGFQKNKVIIQAKLKKEVRLTGWTGRGGETTFTQYEETITLPTPINPEKAKVRAKKGIIEIRVPKKSITP